MENEFQEPIARTVTMKKTYAWATSSYGLKPADFKDGMAHNGVAFSNYELTGWMKVGFAEVVIHLFEEKKITADLVGALEKQKLEVMANCQMALNEIDEKINNLLAITNDVSDVSAKTAQDWNDDGLTF